MGGAYVSLPEDEPTLDLPEDWSPIWPRPEDLADPVNDDPVPYPPGYTAVYSGVIGGSSAVEYNGTTSTTFNLYDHDTYATNRPDGSQITWTASVDGTAVRLRFTGGSYASSVVSSYSHLGGGFWGASTQLEFELTSGDVGKSLTLTALTSFEGQDANDTHTISITAATIRFFGTVTWSNGTPMPGAYMVVNYYTPPFGFPVSKNATTDSNGEWEITHDYVEGNYYHVSGSYAGADTILLDVNELLSLSSRDPMDSSDEEINWTWEPIVTSCKLEMVITSDADDSSFGQVQIEGTADDARFSWNGSAWSNNGGDGNWTLTTTGTNEGYVEFSYADYRDNVSGGVMELYTWVRGSIGVVVDLSVTFTQTIDYTSDTEFLKTQTTEQVLNSGDFTTSEINDWLSFASDGATDIS